jgi:hypothetical protein
MEKMHGNSEEQFNLIPLENVDYHKLKLFFLSMLWRAHASSLAFFSHVDLGVHETKLRSYISSGEAPPSNEYELILFYLFNQPQPPVIIPPWRHKLDGVNVYRFYLPNLMAIIKVDKRPLASSLKPAVFRETPPHFLLPLPYAHSSEMRYIDRVTSLLRLNSKS